MKRTRRICALGMAGIMAFSMAACGSKDGGNGGNGDGSPKGGDGGVASASADLPAIDTIKLGEDYTDLTAEIKVLTQRTDLIDPTRLFQSTVTLLLFFHVASSFYWIPRRLNTSS